MPTVLIAEDSAFVRKLIARTLEELGYEVKATEDGRSALHEARAVQVDLLITDINMPRMDGIKLIGKLREIPKYKKLPVVVMSVETGSAIMEQVVKLGAKTLSKSPVKKEELTEMVKQLIGDP